MNKYFLLLFSLFTFSMSYSQNLQLHYDFLKSNGIKRNVLTATIEMFQEDSIGSTFLFADMNNSLNNAGVNLSYYEITRIFKFDKYTNLQLQIGYGGGNIIADSSIGIYINPAFFIGINYPIKIKIKDVSLNAALLYRYETSPSKSGNIHFTSGWGWNYKKFSLCGFISIWSTSRVRNLVILSEPQFWYNFKYGFSIGSEFEFSYNFAQPDKKLYFYPTIAIKYWKPKE